MKEVLMKNLRKILYVVAIMLLSSFGMLFGCGDKYQNMKLTSSLDDNTIVLYFGDEETNSRSFDLRVDGVPENVSTNIKKPYVAVNGLINIDIQHKSSSAVTNITITAINYGETDVIFTTEEGGKTYSIHVVCELKVESISYNSLYKPYALIGKSIKISTSKCIEYFPEQTTQREVKYSLVNQYAGVSVLEDGTITVDETARNGNVRVKATSASNANASTEFIVTILKGADDILAEYNSTEISESGLFFAPNMIEESYKIVTISVEPNDYNYVLKYSLTDENGNVLSEALDISKISSSLFEIDIIDSESVGITAKQAGDQWLKITAGIIGYDYESEAKFYKLHSENVARNINVFDAEDGNAYDHYTIYDDYKNSDGKPIKVTIDGAGLLANSNFVIKSVGAQQSDKLEILTSKRDSAGYYIPAKLYSEGSSDFDVFANNTVLYLKADSSKIEGDSSLDAVTLQFVAVGSMGLLGEEAKDVVTFDLRRGVSSIELENDKKDDVIMVPIKEVLNGEILVSSTIITLSTLETEYTDVIYTLDSNDGYVLVNNTVLYENSIRQNGKRCYSFTVYGVKNGLYNLTFYSQNGVSIDIKIRVFTKINKITATTATIEENSDIGELVYNIEDNLRTLNGGSITIKTGGVVSLNFNAYFDKYLRQTDYQKITYTYETNNIVKIDGSNRMIGYSEGETEVYVTIQTYDDETDGIYQLSFDVKVYVAIQSIALNTKNATIYTMSTLSNFIEGEKTLKQKYGELTFVLKINPDKTQIDAANDINVQWSGNANSFLNKVYTYNAEENTFNITINADSLPTGLNESNAKMVISVSQYGRILVQEANIIVKNAVKVSKIYDVKKLQNATLSNVVSARDVSKNIPGIDLADYYLYFDSREMNANNKLLFSLNSKIEPTDALNTNLIFIYKQIGDYSNVISINGKEITVLNSGLAYLYICAVDSYTGDNYSFENLNADDFSQRVCVLIKVADGLSYNTSLEISKPSDLEKINQNKESLEKFYIVTNNINLASQKSWTPIGYINGELYEFNGVFDGLIADNFGEKVYASISGLKISGNYEYQGLFAKLGQTAQIKNLEISILSIDFDTTSDAFVGGVAGENSGTCYSTSVKILNANINSNSKVCFGGITGKNIGFVSDCFVEGDVIINSAELLAGGIAGENLSAIDGNTNLFNSSEFMDSYNSMININAEYSSGYLGGVAGYSNGTIRNVSFGSSLIGNDNVGGIVGYIKSSLNNYDLINTFSSGKVVGKNNIGGIAGGFEANQLLKENGNYMIDVLNVAVNMFDAENPDIQITGQNNVGGLFGYAKNLVVANSYVRSYISNENINYEASMQNISAGTIGGVVGTAENVVADKIYSNQKIKAENGSLLGGLFGSATSSVISNAFERNNYNIDSVTIGAAVGKINDSNTKLSYFYSSNELTIAGDGTFTSENYVVTNPTSTSFSTWTTLTQDKSEIDNKDWYLPIGENYPYIVFKQNDGAKLLTVEAPTSLTIKKNSSTYLYDVTYTENNELKTLPDTYVLYKGKKSLIKFSELFNVVITPDDDLLNVSKAYNIVSSDTTVLQATGNTQNDFRLKLNSTGKVLLTVTSKLNIEAKKQITLYVLNAVSGFDLRFDGASSLLVGTNYELKQILSNSYVNNNNFNIKFENDTNGNVAINNNVNTEVNVKNNQKIYIKASKSDQFTLNYSLFIAIEIDGKSYKIPLGNDTGNAIDIAAKSLSFNAHYGIKNFAADANAIELGLNDIATVKYTLVGDDLRYFDSSVGFRSPYFSYDIDDKFNIEFVGAQVYFGDMLKYTSVIDFDKNTAELDRIEHDEITKIVYIFEISANKESISTWFKTHESESYNEGFFNPTVKIAENIEFGSATAQAPVSLSIKRQKIDNISMIFFANAETTRNENNDVVYTINEVPSNAIISGQSGIMKIALAPVNAEVKEVTVKYSNVSGYNLSLNQVLRYETQSAGIKNVRYLDRKPYAVAIDNGKGIILYHTESNYVEEALNSYSTSYDGYLYVNCIISSNVPTGENFIISVDAIYTNGYHYVTSTTLTSRLPSTVSLGYNLSYFVNDNETNQTLYDGIIIPTNAEKEFYIDFTEIIEASDLNNLANIVSPDAIGLTKGLNEVIIKLAEKDNGSVKYEFTNSTCRVYYTIKSSVDQYFELSATIKKVQNSIENTYVSRKLSVQSRPYVIIGINIIDGGNNIITIPQSRPVSPSVKLIVDTADGNKDAEGNLKNEEINSQIAGFQNEIMSNYSYWFGKKVSELEYTQLQENAKYANYYVSKVTQRVSISTKTPNTVETLHVELPFEYPVSPEYAIESIKIGNNLSEKIGEHLVGLNGTTMYIRDFVTLNLTNDVSSEYSIPIRNQAEFEQMSNGTDGEMLYYALANDITLTSYTPRDLDSISFDGNGHTITIENFVASIDNGTQITYNSNYALFATISENSIVKNLTVNYALSNYINMVQSQEVTTSYIESNTFDTSSDDFDITSFNFGGLCVENYGILFNVEAKSTETLSFVNNTSKEANIAGIVCSNYGYISYSISELSIQANSGFIAGFAVNNSKKISNSKVVIDGTISNSFTSDEMSLTAGFVCKNSGSIFGSYVSGANDSAANGVISSQSTVGGFINQNRGEIDCCYSNVTIESRSRASGFVYENEGAISSCYSSSKISESSSAHTPFTGTDASGNFLNNATIDDCYYLYDGNAVDGEYALQIKKTDAPKKSSYAKFVFAEGNNTSVTRNGTWYLNNGHPKLLDADTEIFCQQFYVGITTEKDEKGIDYSHHLWEFTTETLSNISYGKAETYSINKRKINPRTITSISGWNSVLSYMSNNTTGEDLDNSDYVILLCDITAERDSAPLSSKQVFEGKLFGNNMSASGLYIRAGVDNSNKAFGLFGQITSKAVVKDLSISAKQVVASAANCVGIFAGYIEDSDIININVDGNDVEAVQGRVMVGAFAGLINKSTVTKINVSGNVNAGYISNNSNLFNYNNDDSEIENLVKDGTATLNYSYAGTFAGAIVGKTVAKYINVTGTNKVIGFYAGSAVGLVGINAKLILANTEIQTEQYVRAYAFAGGLVGENRGTIDRCFVEHSQDVQSSIDTDKNNTYVTGRNLNFFVGSPKFIGGFVGFNNGGTITNSYAKLDVRTSNTLTYVSGGFVGLAVGGEISNSFAAGSVTNMYVIGGFIGSISNKAFLLGEYTENNKDKRYDDRNVFSLSGSYISESTITLKNNLASNKWLLSRNSSDVDIISQIGYAGFMVGSIVGISEGANVAFNVSNNHFNTQVLSQNRLEPITKNTIVSNANSSLNSSTILNAFVGDQEVTGENLIEIINQHSIGAYGSSFSPSNTNIERDNNYKKADCTVNNVLVSFENMFNRDEILYNQSQGLYAGWSMAYLKNSNSGSSSQTCWILEMADTSASIYPSLVININD